MNVLYTNFHRHNAGGHTTYIRAMLRNKHNTNFLACPSTSNLYQLVEKEGSTTLFDLSFPSKLRDSVTLLKSIFYIAKIIDQNKIDIVHTNGNAENRLIFYASLIAKRKFKVILTKHNDKPIRKRFSSRLRFNHFNAAVICVCESVLNTLGVADIKVPVFVIENGIDTDYWQLEPTKGSTKLALVSIAGTATCKGIHHLIAAIKKLPQALREKLQVKIVGTLPDKHYIANYLKGDYCKDVVSFVGYKDEPKLELQGADIGFVLSDSEETISFACREMMSCSLPVLVSDFGYLPNNVDEKVNGWVTQRANVEAIYNTLLDLLELDPKSLHKMKLAARKKALRDFGIEPMLEKTQAVYESLFTNPTSSRTQ